MLGSDASAPIARLERFRWRTVISAIALTVAAFLLVGQISQVNLLGALRQTNFGWFTLCSWRAPRSPTSPPRRISQPSCRPASRQFAASSCSFPSAFVGVAMPPSGSGHVAVNARYLHRQHVDREQLRLPSRCSQIVNVVTTVVLLIIFGLLTGTGVSRFKIVPSADLLLGLAGIAGGCRGVDADSPDPGDHRPSRAAATEGFLAASGRLALPAAPPRVGHRRKPVADLRLSRRVRLGFIGAWSARSHPPAAVVYLAGNAVGSAAPTPGGLGAVEACSQQA